MTLTMTAEPIEAGPGAETTPVVGVVRPATYVLDHDLLNAEDEVALAVRIEVGRYAAHLRDSGAAHREATAEELDWLVTDGEAARTAFITSNLRLAFATARKFRGRGYSEDDLLQDAYHGLVKAVDRFDHTKGFKFSTYAVWWIRESILSGIRSSGFVKHPEVLWNQIMKVRAVKLRLLDETGVMPSLAEIAAEAELSERDVARCFAEDRPVTSLQTPMGEDDLTLGEVVEDPDAGQALSVIEETFDRDRLRWVLAESLTLLEPADAEVLRARFGLDGRPPRTISMVAQELGVNRQTVRVREQRGLQVLRHPGIRDYLTPYRALST